MKIPPQPAAVPHPALTGLAGLSPAYFGLVMATGIVSLAAHLLGLPIVAQALFVLNIGFYAVLWLLTAARLLLYPRRLFGDLIDHLRAPGFFTLVAGSGVLGSQFVAFAADYDYRAAAVLWLVAVLLWLVLIYTIFAAFTVKEQKPTLDRGISGGWLLAVVATQSIAVLSALLAAHSSPEHRLELNFFALSMWLWGGMLYIWMMSLIFYRYTFFRLAPGDLTPPYWINMGAMAISTLAGSLRVMNAPDAPFLRSLAPFIKGFTVFYWATGTWWIPMLLVLGVWRYVYKRFPFAYDPLYWGAVFPLGMYAVATHEMTRALGFDFLTWVPIVFLYTALVAWIAAAAGLAHELWQWLRRTRSGNTRRTMPTFSAGHAATWLIAALATSGVILRPWRVPEAVWAVSGALALLATGLLPWQGALHAVGKGNDVYLFLAGMMLLAELARREGVFEFCAHAAVRHARGSPQRLFASVYAIGIVVTVFMSNDATAVVLTPAVYAVARKAGARPLPYLLACAFVANAASFVLPISNPANLVVFGAQLPPLARWLQQFALPSLAAIAVTYAGLKWLHRDALVGNLQTAHAPVALGATGRIAAVGIFAVATVLLIASALGLPLGLPTLSTTALVATTILVRKREAPWPTLRQVSWSVLLLVAGLFVLVEGLVRTGVVAALGDLLRAASAESTAGAAWLAGAVSAVACNLLNNLPAGLIAGSAMTGAGVSSEIQSAIAIGIDLGPNLSVTGSLATSLWLIAIRREGEDISAWQFLRVGALLMPLALVAALGVLFVQARL